MRILGCAFSALTLVLNLSSVGFAQAGGVERLHAAGLDSIPPLAPPYEPLVGTVDAASLRQDDELWAAPPTHDLPWLPSWPSYASSWTVGRLTSRHTRPIPAPGDTDNLTRTAQPAAPLLGEPLELGPDRQRSRVMEFNRQTGQLEDARKVLRW
jgi:hypothetical protein